MNLTGMERTIQFLAKDDSNDSLIFLLCKMANTYGYSPEIRTVIRTSIFESCFYKLCFVQIQFEIYCSYAHTSSCVLS